MADISRAEFEQKLIAHAAENPEFRQQLLKDPKGTVAELLNMELPEELTLVVHEEDATTLHLVLPPADDELGAAELAAMAGGKCYSDCSIDKKVCPINTTFP